jgi:hypothetical protein
MTTNHPITRGDRPDFGKWARQVVQAGHLHPPGRGLSSGKQTPAQPTVSSPSSASLRTRQ